MVSLTASIGLQLPGTITNSTLSSVYPLVSLRTPVVLINPQKIQVDQPKGLSAGILLMPYRFYETYSLKTTTKTFAPFRRTDAIRQE